MAPRRIPPEERIAKHSVISGECILWNGPKCHDGYGVIGIGRDHQFRVHRVVYELANGLIPIGLVVCHSCDTPLCINIKHLFLGTPKENTQDMINKGRRPLLIGEHHGMAKLTDLQAEEIKSLRSEGLKLKEISTIFNITFQHVSAICNGRCRANH